jgi:hypothetical protein
MNRILSAAIAFLLIVSVFAILTFDVNASSIKFQMQPLVEDPANDRNPSILYDYNGNVWVFFLSYDRIDAGHYHVFYVTSTNGGNTWTEPSVFLLAYVPGISVAAAVATFRDSTGKLWIAWQNEWQEGLWFTTSSDGINWADAKPLCSPGDDKIGSFIETRGKIWFFLSSSHANWMQISYETTVDGGNSWSDLTTITGNGNFYPHAIVLSNGTILVAYQHYPYTMQYCISSDGGSTWSEATFDNPESDRDPYCIEYGEKIYVFFNRLYDDPFSHPHTTSDIWFRAGDGAEWGPSEPLTDDPENADGCGTLACIRNQMWLVWEKASGDCYTPYDIWLAKTVSTPSPPRDLIASPKLSAVELMWSDPSEGIPLSNFKIYRGDSPGSESYIASVDGNTHEYVDSTVSTSLYYYYVTAVNPVGESPPSNEVKCSAEESFLGLETVVSFENFKTKKPSGILNPLGTFTIQQNFEIAVGGSLTHRYWAQNVIWVWPIFGSYNLTYGLFEIRESNDGGLTYNPRPIVAWYNTISKPYRHENKYILCSTIDGDKLIMKNDCKEFSYSIALNSYIIGLRSDRQPEIVVVGPSSIPGAPSTVVFKDPTYGHVDTYARIGSDIGTWLQCENFLATLPHTGERSKNLKWSTTGDFQYQEGASDQGLFFWPDYDSLVISPP